MSEKIEFPTAQEIEDDQYSTAQVAAMYDEILAIKGKAICINMSRDSLRAELDKLRSEQHEAQRVYRRLLAENAKLREAAQAVVDSGGGYTTEMENEYTVCAEAFDALAAALEADDE